MYVAKNLAANIYFYEKKARARPSLTRYQPPLFCEYHCNGYCRISSTPYGQLRSHSLHARRFQSAIASVMGEPFEEADNLNLSCICSLVQVNKYHVKHRLAKWFLSTS